VSPKRASLRDRPAVETVAADRSMDDTLIGERLKRTEVIDLPVGALMPNRLQPRTRVVKDAAPLEELAESITIHGVLEPILVRPISPTLYEEYARQYEIIAGERRWRASMLANQNTIPALIIEAESDQQMLEVAFTENLQRADLHVLDEAQTLHQMHETLGYTFEEIAQRIGKSKGWVNNRMRLTRLDDELRDLVSTRPDTLGHVYELMRIPTHLSDERARLIAAVRDDAMTRGDLRREVESLLGRTEELPAANPAEPPPANGEKPESAPPRTPRDTTEGEEGGEHHPPLSPTDALIGADSAEQAGIIALQCVETVRHLAEVARFVDQDVMSTTISEIEAIVQQMRVGLQARNRE